MSEEINLQYTTLKTPLPDFIYDGLRNFSADANSYKPQPPALIEKIGIKHNIPFDRIYLTAGADEGIQMFAKAFGKNAFVFTPTYVVYSDVRTFGGKLTELYSIKTGDFSIDPKNIKNASLIYLANPNNPSGFTPKDKVIELIDNNPDSMVVIDEAYGDFAPDLSVADQIDRFPNLSVLRSFSKGYGMAGNRVGYIISDPDTITKVKDFSQWSNTSYLSVGAAITAMDHEDYFKNLRAEIETRRNFFSTFLTKKRFKLLPSKINAVVIQFEDEKKGTAFFDYLAKNNVRASHGNGNSNIGLDKSFVRLAIGTDEQMKKVMEILELY